MRANLVIEQLRAVLLRDGAGLSDGQLLECFIARREDAAFEALVRRHGRMVLGVCRRVLGNHHDAEDAFQATFLVLVRKATSVVPREMVGNWLHGVAYRTALRARAATAKRRERQLSGMPEPQAPQEHTERDLQQLLDRELNGLPEKYRAPLILCGLEGKSEKEAARYLGLPQGTLSGRLSRARALLAKRLARHGVALSLASPSVPTSLLDSTIKAASVGQAAAVSAKVAALTEGVLTAMLLSKFKIMGAVLVLIAAGVGAGMWAYGTKAAEPPIPQSAGDTKATAKSTTHDKQGVVGAIDPREEAEKAQNSFLDMESQKLKQLFSQGDIHVFIDSDPRSEYVRGMKFEKVIVMNNRKFFVFVGKNEAGRSQRMLIDPTRIVAVRIDE